MIVVVADTSPLRYLVRIGEIDLLNKLYGEVVVPGAVLDELRAKDGLPIVRAWAARLPAWVAVRSPAKPLAVTLSSLHRGESQAIALAEELQAVLLLIDDRVGAQVALDRGLTITGTLGVPVEAAQAGVTQIESVLRKLRETNFRATPGGRIGPDRGPDRGQTGTVAVSHSGGDGSTWHRPVATKPLFRKAFSPFVALGLRARVTRSTIP